MSYSYTRSGNLDFECYKNGDSTYYYKEYDVSSGKLIDEFYYIDMKPDNVTINDNGSCDFKYYLFGPDSTIQKVDIALLNDNLDTLKVYRINIKTNDTTVVSFGPLKKEMSYTVSAIAHLHTKIFKDTVRVSGIKFN